MLDLNKNLKIFYQFGIQLRDFVCSDWVSSLSCVNDWLTQISPPSAVESENLWWKEYSIWSLRQLISHKKSINCHFLWRMVLYFSTLPFFQIYPIILEGSFTGLLDSISEACSKKLIPTVDSISLWNLHPRKLKASLVKFLEQRSNLRNMSTSVSVKTKA